MHIALLASLALIQACGDSPAQPVGTPVARESAFRLIPPAPATDSAIPLPWIVVRYRCDSGEEYRVQFNTKTDQALLLHSRSEQLLESQRPASGMWYANGLVEIRGKGHELTIRHLPQTPVNCLAAD